MAVAAMVTGLCSITMFWVPLLGITTGVAAIILASLVFNQLKQNKEIVGYKGMVIAGLVTGIIGTIASFTYFLSKSGFGDLLNQLLGMSPS